MKKEKEKEILEMKNYKEEVPLNNVDIAIPLWNKTKDLGSFEQDNKKNLKVT